MFSNLTNLAALRKNIENAIQVNVPLRLKDSPKNDEFLLYEKIEEINKKITYKLKMRLILL